MHGHISDHNHVNHHVTGGRHPKPSTQKQRRGWKLPKSITITENGRGQRGTELDCGAPHVLILHLAQAVLSTNAAATLRRELVHIRLQDSLHNTHPRIVQLHWLALDYRRLDCRLSMYRFGAGAADALCRGLVHMRLQDSLHIGKLRRLNLKSAH